MIVNDHGLDFEGYDDEKLIVVLINFRFHTNYLQYINDRRTLH